MKANGEGKKQQGKFDCGIRGIRGVLLCACLCFYTSVGYTLPENGTIVGGSGSISQQGNTLQVNQSSDKLIINWQNFNTSASERVNFSQPGVSSIALNRITSGLPTVFAGLLSANGQIWIINPAGVLFTSTSRVDVGGLLATTSDIKNEDFMAGNYKFQSVPGFLNGAVINDGEIIARGGDAAANGLVALVAPGVENNGVIQANLGKVVLASGTAYTLDLYGDQLIQFASDSKVQQVAVAPDGRVLKDAVANNGKITADGGQVYLAANTAGNIVDNVISMKGVIEAKTVSQGKNGVIILGGDDGQVNISGTINTSAQATGNGGKIIIKGHKTVVTGKLESKGGTQSGDGGFIETSGDYLNINQMTLDLSAPLGKAGSWLLDPYNITVLDFSTLTPPYPPTNNTGAPLFSPTGDDSLVDVTLLINQLNAGTNVTLDTGEVGGQAGNITIDAPIIKSMANNASLTLYAGGNIIINQPIDLSLGGSLFLQSGTNLGNGIQLKAPIHVAGDFTAIADGSGGIMQTAPFTIGGEVDIKSVGTVALNDPANDFAGSLTLDMTAFGVGAVISNINPVFKLDDINTLGLLQLDGKNNAIVQESGADLNVFILTLAPNNTDITLTNPTNAIQNLIVAGVNGGDIHLYNNQNLQILSSTQTNGGDLNITANGRLRLFNSGIYTNGGNVDLTAVGNLIGLNAPIDAVTGTVTFHSPVEVGIGVANDQTISGGSVRFMSTLDGNLADTPASEGLTINIQNGGSAQFDGLVGGSAPLKFLTINGAGGSVILNTSGVSTFGAQDYEPPVTLTQPLTDFTGTAITFGGGLDGSSAGGQSANIHGNAIFNNNIGGTNALNDLLITGSSIFNTASATTLGDQTYNGLITINQNFDFTGNNILFGQDVNALPYSLAINAAGLLTGNGVITSGILTIQSGAGINGSANTGTLNLGGSGGSDLINTFVDGNGGETAALMTNLLNNASGQFFVNGFLVTRPVPPVPPVPPVNNTPEPPVVIPPDISNNNDFNTPIKPSVCLGGGCARDANNIVIDDSYRLPIGVVTCSLGFSVAQDQNGNERILLPGDVIYADEKVVSDGMSRVTVKMIDGKNETINSGQAHSFK